MYQWIVETGYDTFLKEMQRQQLLRTSNIYFLYHILSYDDRIFV